LDIPKIVDRLEIIISKKIPSLISKNKKYIILKIIKKKIRLGKILLILFNKKSKK